MAFDRRLLQAFEAVAEHGSVGRAAAALNSTQPTVSRYINALEQEVGQTLFSRHARGMSLTRSGHELLPRFKLLLHEMASAQDAIDGLLGLRRGALRVGGVAAVTRGFLPDVLAEVAVRAPHLHFEVLEDSEDRLELALARGEIDVAFVAERPRQIDTVPTGKLGFDDRCVVFCSRSHALLKDGTSTIQSLLEYGWAMPHPGATPRLHFMQMIRDLGYPVPEIGLQTDSLEVIIAMVARSSLIGWLPLRLLRVALMSDAIVHIDEPHLEWRRTFQPYRRARGSLPPALPILVDAIAATNARRNEEDFPHPILRGQGLGG